MKLVDVVTCRIDSISCCFILLMEIRNRYIYNSHPSCAKFSLQKKHRQVNKPNGFLRIKNVKSTWRKLEARTLKAPGRSSNKKRQQLSADVVGSFAFLGFFALGGWDLSDVDLGHGWKGKTHNPESFILDLGSNHWFFSPLTPSPGMILQSG